MTRKKKEQRRVDVTVEASGCRLRDEYGRSAEFLATEVGIPAGHTVEIILASTERMRELKLAHFGEDVDTDVIAFPTDFPELGDGVPSLAGEIFVGVDQVARNAAAEGWSLSEELLFVTAHGLLHLRGWDDGSEADRRAMFDEQYRLLALLRGQGVDCTRVVELVAADVEMVVR